MKDIFENWRSYIEEEPEEVLNEGLKDILAAIFLGVTSMIPGGLEAAEKDPVEAIVNLPAQAQQKVRVNIEPFEKQIPGYEDLTLPDQVKQLVTKFPVGFDVKAGKPMCTFKGRFKRDY